MQHAKLVDEQAVLDVFESRLSGTAASPAEIIADGALSFAGSALRESVTSLEDSVTKFVDSVRLSALEAKGGDVSKAAEAIADNTNALELFAQGQRVKKATLHK
jgi:hypothetical protein